MSKRRLWLAGIPVICALAVARCGQDSWRKEEGAGQGQALGAGHGAAGESSGPSAKASTRSKRGASTHSPERLKQFFLQPVEVAGLPLSAALQQLKTAYEQACVETGETALDLKFQIPAGKDKPLRINPGVATLEGSIQRLAMFSGMKVKREGSTYNFQAPPETGKPLKKTVKIGGSTYMALSKACYPITPDGSRDFAFDLRLVGLDLDPATRVVFLPATGSASEGSLTIEGTSAADELAVSGYLAALGEPLNVPQHKIQARLIELAAGSEWTTPDLAQYSSQEIQLMLRELMQRKDASVMMLPETLAREGEPAKIELGSRELIVPVEGAEDQFETHNLGVVIDFSSRVLGFGSQTSFNVTATAMPENWSPGQPAVDTHVDLKDTAWAANGNSFLRVQERADGSRVLIVVTSAMEMAPSIGFRLGL